MSGSIRAIESDSIHRIHSGQVVLDVQGAIKELVENSLDAGATSIDVRIKDNGLDSVEISDNGSGIAQEDWEFIGLKHHTSKLPSLSELYKVTTFGFRGEALSALCALCESVTVVTATKETAPMGTIIKLGRDGRVADSSGKVARPRGTTITLTGLFVPLPVRRKEFERTVKRELTKALTLLTAYALVPACASLPNGQSGVRLRVETIGSGRNGKRSTQLSTDGKGSLRSSVGAVWGIKALDGTQDVDLDLDVEVDRLMAKREGITEMTQHVKVSGLISSAQWGQGRSSADRQFYYINGRPCNLTSVARAVNEVYKTFNTNQVPMAILDFQIPPESVDINVSPDKRTIFVHSEDRLIEALKTALDEFFQPSRSTFSVGGATQTVKTIRHIQSQLSMGTNIVPAPEQLRDEAGQDTEAEGDTYDDDVQEPEEAEPVQAIAEATENMNEIAERISRRHTQATTHEEVEVMEIDTEGEEEPSQAPSRSSGRRHVAPASSPPRAPPKRVVQQTLITSSASWSPDRKSASTRSARAGPDPSSKEARKNFRKRLEVFASQSSKAPRAESSEEPEEVNEDPASEGPVLEVSGDDGEEAEHEEAEPETVEPILDAAQGDTSAAPKRSRPADESIFEDEAGDTTPENDAMMEQDEQIPMSESTPNRNGHDRPPLLPARTSSNFRNEIVSDVPQGELTLRFDLPRLKSRYRAKRQHQSHIAPNEVKDAFSAVKEAGLADAAGIANRDFALAEEALSRVISKADFEKMEVLGQFNKGFIIARLKSDKGKGKEADDLFIIDQHASDEKYNFETLQRTTVIKGQALIRPRPLQLTAGDEIVAMENLDILHSNGFDVKVDEDQPPGRGERIKLMAMPVSKDTTFDFKDLEQLLHLLSDGARPSGQMVRCSKARSMFAMRACRKSVMIGKSLTKGQMVQLLRNMGTIDQPWNCPHGRPTMRHLTKIEPPTKSRSGRGKVDWKKWKRDHMAATR
ncbi:hypothetical protein CI109_102282 [Kwoniella shandongensis]|uniref:DNA mismatch repair protein MutL n=1 Tax=Kwoniella shandongensis TaxID=1734106 RepID=A0A5M6C1T5_9TREE|nr:uncharacterized protein CI109_003564 [Kwoniella shandongensis]KAA5527912.1 hypothetical protein CI109_003564 [Kwoniella shandongensis]